MANRLTQEAVEVLRDATAKARLTQEAVEVLRDATAKARLTQECVEVLRTVAIYVPPASNGATLLMSI